MVSICFNTKIDCHDLDHVGLPHDLEKPNIFESSPEHFEPYPTSSIRSAIRPERLVRVDRLVL